MVSEVESPCGEDASMSTGTILLIALFVVGPLLMMLSHRGGHGGRGSMMGGCGHGGHAGHGGADGSAPEDESVPMPMPRGSGRYGSDADADPGEQRQPKRAGRR